MYTLNSAIHRVHVPPSISDLLTHLCLASPKKGTLANSVDPDQTSKEFLSNMVIIIISKQTSLIQEMDSSKDLRLNNTESILHKSIVDHYRPVRVADGPITACCRFIKNASWEPTQHKWVNELKDSVYNFSDILNPYLFVLIIRP